MGYNRKFVLEHSCIIEFFKENFQYFLGYVFCVYEICKQNTEICVIINNELKNIHKCQ